jgi:uncharacterized membrane protein
MMQNRCDLNTIVWSILLGGLGISFVLICIGLAWQWLVTGTFGIFPSISAMNLGKYLVNTIWTFSADGVGPVAVVHTGIAILLLTPFLRVLASVLFFIFQEANRKFSAITGFVLVVLGIVLFVW